ncbi:MAG: hypothetical protein ACRDWA_00620 [Acidimicrobiia bacterium]
MSKMIQVRNVSDRLHRDLSKRARSRSKTLTAYIEELLEKEVSRPPAEEVFERVSRRPPTKLRRSTAELIREERALRYGE